MKSWQDAVFHLGCKGTHLHWARTPRQRATRRFRKPPTAWPFKEKRPSLWERRCLRPGTSDKHLRRPVDIAIGQRKILWLQNCNNISKGNALRKWRPVVVVRKKLSEVYWLWAEHDLLCVVAKLTCAHCRELNELSFSQNPVCISIGSSNLQRAIHSQPLIYRCPIAERPWTGPQLHLPESSASCSCPWKCIFLKSHLPLIKHQLQGRVIWTLKLGCCHSICPEFV